ncbi:MAG TPA: OmpA family protein [Methylomirabilota bacterium]|jgi:outer membrane protein OmpA-like peptidoglycan-associated protein
MRSWIGWSVLVVLLSGCAAAGPYGISLGSPGSTSGESVDLRVTRVEGRLDQMNKRIDAVGERMEGVEGGVIHAQETADQASRRATAVDTRLTRLWTNRFNQRTASSLEVFFPQDSSDLNDAAQTALLGVAKDLEDNPGLTVELGGYTDRRGALDYNYGLGQRRVNAVRRFLIDRGISLARIRAASLGPASEDNLSDAKKRRVTIRLMVDQD